MKKEIKEYFSKVNGVSQITFNPDGPGSVRIHLVPPKKLKLGIYWTVIINGQDLLPLTSGWAILLREFIEECLPYDGVSLDDKTIKKIVNKAISNVQEVFVKTPKETLLSDLKDIIETLTDIAKQKDPAVEIGYMSLKKYGKYMESPHRIDLMVSSMMKNGMWNCNQKCMHCYAKGQENGNSLELSTDELKLVIDKLRKTNVSQITFTGGEPTLRQDLVELIEYASWFVTRLNTNGVLLTKGLCEELKKASLDSVQVTLYSYNKDIHNLLVGSNNFERTIEGIKNALTSGLNVSVNTPLCNINKDYKETLMFLNDLGVKYFSCSGLIQTGASTKQSAKETYLSKEEIEDVLKIAKTYCNNNNLEISFTSPGWIKEEVLKKMGLVVPSCGACLSNMAITPNGDVVPCQSWLSSDVLGNILKEDFNSIYNSKACKKIKKEALNSKQVCLLSKRGGGN